MKFNFKHIYIEITNICQFNCSFCPKTKAPNRSLSIDQINVIFKNIKEYTNEVYLHLLGEPLIHPNLKEIISLAKSNNLIVNITTNGFLLREKLDILLDTTNIRKINISLHAMEDLSNNDKSLVNYMHDIIYSSEKLRNNGITIIYRLWNSNKEYSEILNVLRKEYNTDLKNEKTALGGLKLENKLFLSINEEFEWPVNSKDNSDSFCYALKTHIAINSNGDVLPCCLDSEGINVLGNIFENNLKTILSNEITTKILTGFRQNKCVTELCKKCTYKLKDKV